MIDNLILINKEVYVGFNKELYMSLSSSKKLLDGEKTSVVNLFTIL